MLLSWNWWIHNTTKLCSKCSTQGKRILRWLYRQFSNSYVASIIHNPLMFSSDMCLWRSRVQLIYDCLLKRFKYWYPGSLISVLVVFHQNFCIIDVIHTYSMVFTIMTPFLLNVIFTSLNFYITKFLSHFNFTVFRKP